MPNATLIMSLAFRAAPAFGMRWPIALALARKIRRSFSEMFSRFASRSPESEIMDDLTRPAREFDAAYRELEVINRRLGGIRAIERFLPRGDLTMLDVGAGACDVSEALIQKRPAEIVVLD